MFPSVITATWGSDQEQWVLDFDPAILFIVTGPWTKIT